MLWEYRIVSLPTQKEPKEAQEALNSLGDAGWELVSAYTHRDSVNYVFKSRSKSWGERIPIHKSSRAEAGRGAVGVAKRPASAEKSYRVIVEPRPWLVRAWRPRGLP
jgi:hypothetical protein